MSELDPWIKKGLEESGNQPHILSLLFYQRNVIPLSSSALQAKRGFPGQREKEQERTTNSTP